MNKSILKENAIKVLLTGAASLSLLIVFLIFIFLFKEAGPFLASKSAPTLFNENWIPISFQKAQFGLLPLISGSLLVTALAILIALPFGIFGAVYIAEIAIPMEREILKPFIELLAGIPSVVIGFWGLIIVAPLVKSVFNLNSGLTALTGGILLALMAIPTIISIADDAIRNVPSSYKEASMALGASKMQTIWKITFLDALSGIIAAIMLGIGRVVGETMTVLMVTGNAAIITLSPFESVRTMTATIAAEMGEVAFGSVHYRALFCVGIVLLITTFAINIIAQSVLKKHRRA